MGKLKFVLASLSFVFAGLCLGMPQMNSSERRQLEREARLVVDLMQNYHESGRMFRELNNREMLTGFMAELDPGMDYLLKDDIEFVQMRFGRTLRSVYLLKGDLQPAFEIFDLFAQRVKERTRWIEQRLERGFEFEQDEVFTPDSTHSAAATAADADQRWERKLKDEVLAEIVRGRTEPDAITTVTKRYAKFNRQITTMDSLAVRERFFDGLLQAFDPHSGYFSADSTREFALEMMGAVAGAGLEIKKENGLCLVSSIQTGGPADLTTDLRPGDIIEAYGEEGAALTSVKGKRLREIVGSIRGKAGTKLQLAYRHAGETEQRDCLLVRASVVSIDDRARGTICHVPSTDGTLRRIGWIDLPMFYASNEEGSSSSATKDVAELLSQMNKIGIEGIVLDLRNNGGGAVTEALALTGLFAPKSLVMLTRGLEGKVKEHYATEPAEPYQGPLVVLTSAHSASASEIFAGTMKFNRRALIVGSPSTFGKGTAQNYIELAKTSRSEPNDVNTWGTLRLTYERFYQPDGKAVQCNGIAADIVLPQINNPGFEREAALPHALPAESVPAPAAAVPVAGIKNPITPQLCAQLRLRTEGNIGKLPEWSIFQREKEFYENLMTSGSHSMQLQKRQAEQSEIENKGAALRSERRKLASALVYSTETIEIESVENAIAVHRNHLASLTLASGESALNHLEHGGFIYKTDKDLFRRLWLNQIEYARFLGDAEPLAAAFTSGSGLSKTPEQMYKTLQALSLLEEPAEHTVLACFTLEPSAKPDPVAVRKGVEAVLLRMTEIEGDFRRHRAALDVQLRECLRITADWSELLASPPAEARP
jgi:carboxyl-terminal processing protease